MVMTHRIRQLPTVLADQIAAGEVVERPASAAKELIENAIDAGAAEIRVEVMRGGIALLRVRDDGHGIPPEDMALALSRHATSKIASLQDLEGVLSMGFRGEALPSIASVARFTLTSRMKDAKDAYAITACDGKISSPVPAAHPLGTTVEIRDLFYNTPARRRFLRADRTEFRHLEDVVRRLALARSDIAFSLEHNRKRTFSVPSAGDAPAQADRLGRLLGLAFMRDARPVEAGADGLRLSGWLAGPDFSRSESNVQHFFLNRRMIRDPLIRHAVNLSYEGLLPEGRFPGFVLHLSMPPQEVDVNVHPTKHEVRFVESRQVHDFIVAAIVRVLRQDQAGARADEARASARGTESEPHPEPHTQPHAQSPPRSHPLPQPEPLRVTGAEAVAHHPLAYAPRPGARSSSPSPSPSPGRTHVGEGRAGYASPAQAPPRPGLQVPAPDEQAVRACLQLPGRFFLARSAEQWLLVDKRLSALAAFDWHLGGAQSPLRSLPLLLPIVESMDEACGQSLEDCRPQLQRLGVVMRETAPGRISLLEVPWMLAGTDHVQVFAAARRWLNETRAKRTGKALSKMLADLYAHSDTSLAGLTELLAYLRRVPEHKAWVGVTEHKLQRLMSDAQ